MSWGAQDPVHVGLHLDPGCRAAELEVAQPQIGVGRPGVDPSDVLSASSTRLAVEAFGAYDRAIGFDFSERSVDNGSRTQTHGLWAGDRSQTRPTGARLGWTRSLLADRDGIPGGWPADGANRHDTILLPPTLQAAADRGLLVEVDTLHLDRGYDNPVVRDLAAASGIADLICSRKRPPGPATGPLSVPLGMRWPIERINSWLSNLGQLRRTTDRRTSDRLAQLALAVVFLITPNASTGALRRLVSGRACTAHRQAAQAASVPGLGRLGPRLAAGGSCRSTTWASLRRRRVGRAGTEQSGVRDSRRDPGH
jgi:hypothetical protein